MFAGQGNEKEAGKGSGYQGSQGQQWSLGVAREVEAMGVSLSHMVLYQLESKRGKKEKHHRARASASQARPRHFTCAEAATGGVWGTMKRAAGGDARGQLGGYWAHWLFSASTVTLESLATAPN